MRRRAYLAAVVGVATSAGCLGSVADGGTTVETRSPPERTTATPALSDVPCPSSLFVFGGDVSRVQCFRDDESAPTVMRPADAEVSLPTGSTSFTLANDADATLHTSFYTWNVHRYEDGEWFRVAPLGAKTIGHELGPGETHTWTLSVDNTDLSRSVESGAGTDDVTVEGLGGGVYLFTVAGRLGDGERVGYAARFRVRGDPLALSATAAVTDAVREGDAVTVTVEPNRDGYRAALVATRVESPPESPRRLVTEQVIRQPPLRNALAYATPGVNRVRVETVMEARPPFPFLGDPPLYVEYEGGTFRLDAETLDG